MQLLRRILREAEETLEKLTAIKKRLHDEYEVQIELAEGQNIGAKKRKVLAGLAIEERKQLRNIDKFLRSTLFPSTKRIQALPMATQTRRKTPTRTAAAETRTPKRPRTSKPTRQKRRNPRTRNQRMRQPS